MPPVFFVLFLSLRLPRPVVTRLPTNSFSSLKPTHFFFHNGSMIVLEPGTIYTLSPPFRLEHEPFNSPLPLLSYPLRSVFPEGPVRTGMPFFFHRWLNFWFAWRIVPTRFVPTPALPSPVFVSPREGCSSYGPTHDRPARF